MAFHFSPREGSDNEVDSHMIDLRVAKVDDHASPASTANPAATPAAPAAPAAPAPRSFFSLANLKVAQVNIVAGTLNGYSIGFVGVYSTLYGFSTNCALYKRPTSCTTLSNAKCEWVTSGTGDDFCGWADGVTCSTTYTNESSCTSDSKCSWNYSDSNCENRSGYSSSHSGIFAGAMIVGCMIGSFFSGALAKKLGPKLSFSLIGVVGIVSSVLYHIATAADQFWVLCTARLIIGVVLGLVCVAAPMYVAENAHPNYSKMIGVLFQVFTTFGIFIAALMGLALGQSVKYDVDKNQDLGGRMQGLCVFSTLLSVVMVCLGLFLGGFGFRDKQVASAAGNTGDDYAQDAEKEGDAAAHATQYTYGQMLGPLVMGGVVAGTLQLTGINAVMNYAPTIMGSLGLAPLVGNFIVMLWNFVTTIGSIPLASVFTMRQLFLAGSLVTSAMCLFMCGIPVYPSVTKEENAKNGVAITGILIFIAFFEMGVGPCFYVLAQDLFPPSFRPKGSSVTMVIQFIFNVIINVCYPIATEAMSGGPSGDQDKGQAIAFIFFGCIGLVCFVFQIFFLFPWEDDKEAEHDLDEAREDADMAVNKVDPALPPTVSLAVRATDEEARQVVSNSD